MITEETKKIFEQSKINAELIIKPYKKAIPLYKLCIITLILFNIVISCLFGYYIYKSMYNNRLSTRAFVTTINKTIERCNNVKRSDARMD